MKSEDKLKNAIIWIDKLFSTDLLQASGQLGDKESGFCCLGLGCHILNIPYDIDKESNVEFMESVGLLNPVGESKNNDLESLVALNDDFFYSFKQIADHLTANPEEYFESEVAEKISNNFNKK